MDKNQRTGFLLLFLLMTVWYFLTAPSQEEIQRQQFIVDSIAQAKAKALEPATEEATAKIPASNESFGEVSDSAKVAGLSGSYGAFAQAAHGSNEQVSLSNDLIDIRFNTKGGMIDQVELKNYKKIVEVGDDKIEEKRPLLLLEDDKNRMEYILPLKGVGNISTSDLYFKANKSGSSVTMVADAGGGKTIEHVYTLKPGSYELDYKLKLNGVSAMLEPGTESLSFKWKNYLDKIEKNYNFEKYYSTVYFKESNEDSDYCSCRGDGEESTEKSLDWFGHSHQFFNTTMIAKDKKFTQGEFTTQMLDADADDMKLITSEVKVPINQTVSDQVNLAFYLGPNDFETLNAYDNGMDEIIPFGRSLFGSINRWVIRPSFDFLSRFIGSKGIVIIVLIFILKMLLYPLMYKMLHSQAKMGALKPELAKLKEKFKDDSQKVQMETMKVYREYGVSPLGGCMPMLLQMPIWYALFRFFPASLRFRQESFLWASDLSSYDSIMNLPFEIPAFGSHISLFTILWAVSTVAYTYYNSKHMDMSANPAMKYAQYFMPIMFLFFFNNYASGLTCYMFFSNIFNVAQMVLTKKFVFDDERILKELKEKKAIADKNPKKKNSFQQRLEEAMKQQQMAQKQKDKNKGKKK